MLFSSYEFILIYLPIVFAVFYLIGSRSQFISTLWLSSASLFFYAWWSINALPLLLVSIIVNYFFGIKLSQYSQTRRGKWLLSFSVILNLSLLGYFKYAGFFVRTLNDGFQHFEVATWSVPNIILPIGLSFYTFTQIAFLVDCWQGKVQERRFLDYVLFVSYFPHLIAGPFLHHSQMMPQFAQARTYQPNYDKWIVGVILFSVGLFKKILIADPLSVYADQFFNTIATANQAISFYTAWAGVLAYTFQIYFDFSGYSDMAIGISLLFGIQIPINFKSPYRAASIIDFWRCWHISLSAFLRDYLYIPLGGNKNGKVRRYANLIITMLLGGLWHGASWNFVLWGALHGTYLTINHMWRAIFPNTSRWSYIYKIFAWAITFLSVCFAWVLFRSENLEQTQRIYSGMIGLTSYDLQALIITLRDFLGAEVMTDLIVSMQNSGSIGVVIPIGNLDIFSLVIAWLVSTCKAFLAVAKMDGLQCLIVALFISLMPFNSVQLANSLDADAKVVEKTYLWLCAAIALYLLVSCLWVMDKHQAFIYFQF